MPCDQTTATLCGGHVGRRPGWSNDARIQAAGLHPHHVAGNWHAATAIGLRVAGIYPLWQSWDLGILWVYVPESRSWASVELLETLPYPVEHAGPRRLFDEVEFAFQCWRQAGEPGMGDWLVTVTPTGQTMTLEPGS